MFSTKITDKKYLLDTAENREFLQKLGSELLDFGHRFPSPEGGSYYLGDDGTPWKEYGRETWITSRMAHVYSIGCLLGHEGSGELADAALKGLRGELHDKEYGGWYAGRTAENAVMPGKQCYAHAFVILAAASAVLAERAGSDELLENALEVFDRRFWNEEEGLTCDTWNTDFTLLDTYRGINANMHTVEAFLAAADVTGRDVYRFRAGRIIGHILSWAAASDWRIPEHFTDSWEPQPDYHKDHPADPFKPYGATPGHGIEWARLIVQWALSTHGENRQAAEPYINAAEKLYGRAVRDGWCVDGEPGLIYTTDWKGNTVIHDRMHWTLAEAINTSAVLYRVTKDEKYKSDYSQFMKYLDEKMLDHVNGSWFHQMDEKNRVIGTVWPGKPDIYHALQSTLIPCYSPEISITKAVKEERFYE